MLRDEERERERKRKKEIFSYNSFFFLVNKHVIITLLFCQIRKEKDVDEEEKLKK